jgi:hypothetical protein
MDAADALARFLGCPWYSRELNPLDSQRLTLRLEWITRIIPRPSLFTTLGPRGLLLC